MSAGILDGIVVADFSRILAGPLAAAHLADLGATVVKVERKGAGDDTRRWGPPWTDNSSSYFESANRSKLSIALDFDDPEDLATARELARAADVMIENFKTGSLDAKGLGYADVAAANPGIVYCSITGFGSKAGAGLPGYDFLVQALGGLMSITGEADGAPLKVGIPAVDVFCSKDAMFAIMAALYERERSGRGQLVEVNLLSSLLGAMVNRSAAYLASGQEQRRAGNEHPSIAPYETLRCADGLLAVACGNDAQFAAMAGALGDPSLAATFATNRERVERRRELVPALEALLMAHGPDRGVDHWVDVLTDAGVPAGKVESIGSAFELAEKLGLEPRVRVDDGIDQVRHPVTFSRTPVDSYARPPRVGEHADAVHRLIAERSTP